MRNTAPSYAREAHERVLKRFIFEETEADEEATNHSTSLVSNSNVSTDTGRNSSSSDVGGEGATAQDALPSLQLVPLRGIAVDRCLALWHFLLGFAKPLKLRQLPHWMELHDAVHVVSGQVPPHLAESQVIGVVGGGQAVKEKTSAASPAAVAAPMSMVVATSLLNEIAVALTTCAREDHQPSLSHSMELAEVKKLDCFTSFWVVE